MNQDTRRVVLISLLLAVAALIVFWQVKDFGFINYDDPDYILDNPPVRSGLTAASALWAFTSFHASNWHPLTWISHMLDVQLFGLSPGGHHIINLLFHIANSILLFLILMRMTNALWRSAFVAVLFALHPLHVESVAWISERKDVLSSFFWMLTMGAYALYAEHPGLKRYLVTLLFFALGLMAKPMLVTLPFVLLLLDFWPLGRLRGKEEPKGAPAAGIGRKTRKMKKRSETGTRTPKPAETSIQWSLLLPLVKEKTPFFLFSAASSVITYLAQQKGGAVATLELIPFTSRIGNAVVSYAKYIVKLFWPVNPSVFYPHEIVLPAWQVAGALLMIVLITLFAVGTMRRAPFLAAGWLWYLGTLVPVIGIVQVGAQAIADRYTYIPFIGLFIMLAWGTPELLKRWNISNTAIAVLAGIVLCASAFASWTQAKYWTDDITLFQRALKSTTGNYVAHFRLAYALSQQNRFEEARHHFTEALFIKPDSYQAHNNLGIVLRRQGKTDEAIRHFGEAIRLKPDLSEGYNNMGIALLSKGMSEEGLKYLQKSISINPSDPEIHYVVASAMAQNGRLEESLKYFGECLRINPRNAMAHNNMGIVLARLGKIDEAIAHFREALWINPGMEQARDNLRTAMLQKKTAESRRQRDGN